jgi:S-adenosylmethionine hydrolase
VQTDDPVPAVFFLSDFGTADEFVGIVHSVLHSRAPGVPVIDLGHEVPPYDVAAGASMLVRCAPYLSPGVVLAVVDPGVGSGRRGVAIETIGTGPSWLVGPDNGLLVPMARALGGVQRAVVLRRSPPTGSGERTESAGEARGRTFDGRDLFAPVAARLVLGAPPEELGDEVDPETLVTAAGTAVIAARDVTPGPGLEAPVTWIDRFGNIQIEAGPDMLDRIGVDRGSRALVTLPGPPCRSAPARRVDVFDDLDAGELGLLVDSSGRLALACCRASAADHLGSPVVGETVRIAPDEQGEAPA